MYASPNLTRIRGMHQKALPCKLSHRIGKAFSGLLMVLVVSACSSKQASESENFFKRLFSKDTYRIYRIDIPQGNEITAEKLKKLKRGLSVEQVEYLLGSSITPTLFRQNRRDYTYYFISGTTAKRQKQTLTLFFENNTLVQICQGQRNSGC